MKLDARGIGCPKPVIMAEEALNKMGEGIIEILVDNEASVSNLARFAKKKGFYTDTVKEDNHWKVKIAKGYACEPEGEAPFPEEAGTKDLLLIVGTDVMGRDDELGKILMKAFFETMKVTKQVPHTIFFLNTGVRLTTLNEEILPALKDFEAMGVEIFSCGTCLKHYNLESELKVGFRGTTNHIVEGLVDFKKTVWIG
jgi:selenium metabolism protein YedF